MNPKTCRIALVGDFDAKVPAHAAIEKAAALFNASKEGSLETVWIGTDKIVPGADTLLRECQGIWCVPASPYRHTAGALWAIEFARTELIPFLGTCGGYQHALLEYARNSLGLVHADHQELTPDGKFLVLTRLDSAMCEASEVVIMEEKSRLRAIYDRSSNMEPYNCSYGLNPACERLFQNGALEIAARSPDGRVRAVELKGHPFFIGVGFQPERLALEDDLHPLVRAFFRAACARAAGLGTLPPPGHTGDTGEWRYLGLLH